MNAIIDIGNTFAKIGWFSGDDLVKKWSFEHPFEEKILSFLTNHNPENIIISNVAQSLSDSFLKNCGLNRFCLILNHLTPLPIKNDYQTPGTLGKDRLAAAVGAYSAFPNQNALIVDCGSCITYDLVNLEGIFLGGNISPGLQMRFNAVHHFTQRLPKLTPDFLNHSIGKTTDEAIKNGIQLGLIFEIDGFINLFNQMFTELNVILTGGDAYFFAEKLKNKIFVNQNLVLEGLNKILNYNVR